MKGQLPPLCPKGMAVSTLLSEKAWPRLHTCFSFGRALLGLQKLCSNEGPRLTVSSFLLGDRRGWCSSAAVPCGKGEDGGSQPGSPVPHFSPRHHPSLSSLCWPAVKHTAWKSIAGNFLVTCPSLPIGLGIMNERSCRTSPLSPSLCCVHRGRVLKLHS